MKVKHILALGALGGAGLLAYGNVVEARRLTVRREKLALPLWPIARNGYRVAVIGDLHLRTDIWQSMSFEMARTAVAAVLESKPDVILITGDLVEEWTAEMPALVGEILAPLRKFFGRTVMVPGNHDYDGGDASLLEEIAEDLGVLYLRNESGIIDGIQFVGVDSANRGMANPFAAMATAEDLPTICLWHEPDLVEWLPRGCALQVSGHSHGGQFAFRVPGFGEWTPVMSRNGRKYRHGFFAKTSTPLFVHRGIGNTFFPSRFNCPPEIAVLELWNLS